MTDDAPGYAERARAWIKEQEPTAEEIRDAHARMAKLIETKPHLTTADTDECLEVLITAYGEQGGLVDDLLAASAQAGIAPCAVAVSGEAQLDTSPLCAFNEEQVVLEPEVKQATFRDLKALLDTRGVRTR